MKTVAQLRRPFSPRVRRAVSSARRMVVGESRATAKWRLDGHDHVQETVEVEMFQGIGFSARPPAGQGEVIVQFVGGPNHGCVVATRDEKTRQAIAGALGADETAIFNSAALVHVKANGTIEARSKAGTAVALATKADLDALKTAITNAVPLAGDGGAQFKAQLLAALASWPVGTTKFKAE